MDTETYRIIMLLNGEKDRLEKSAAYHLEQYKKNKREAKALSINIIAEKVDLSYTTVKRAISGYNPKKTGG